VLASLAIPRFTEASVKAKVAEAPRVIASFESAYLAAEAELGSNKVTGDDLIFKTGDVSSKWFSYSLTESNEAEAVDDAVGGIDAEATSKLGAIEAKEKLTSEYHVTSGTFKHGFSKCEDPPEPTVKDTMSEAEKEAAKKVDDAAKAAFAKTCKEVTKYAPNFL